MGETNSVKVFNRPQYYQEGKDGPLVWPLHCPRCMQEFHLEMAGGEARGCLDCLMFHMTMVYLEPGHPSKDKPQTPRPSESEVNG